MATDSEWEAFEKKLQDEESSFDQVKTAPESERIEILKDLGYTSIKRAKLLEMWRNKIQPPPQQDANTVILSKLLESQLNLFDTIEKSFLQKEIKAHKTLDSRSYTEIYKDIRSTIATKPTLEDLDIKWNETSPELSSLFNKPPNQKEAEDTYQTYFETEVRSFLVSCSSNYRLERTAKNPYLINRAPDVSFFISSDPLSSLHVLVVGEIKKAWEKVSKREFKRRPFENHDRGEAWNYVDKVIEAQPLRKKAFGFLTDCIIIEFYTQEVLDSGKVVRLTTPPFPLRSQDGKSPGTGLVLLANLLTASLETLGFELPRPSFKTPTTLTHLLGRGATSTVWRTEDGRVVKILSKSSVTTEFNMLEAVKRIVKDTPVEGCVPSVVEKSNDDKSMLLTPLGVPVSALDNLSSSMLRGLLYLLAAIHLQNIVHRDIRPDNLVTAQDKLVLIDWGFALSNCTRDFYQGTLHFASDAVLTSLSSAEDKKHLSTPSDDLHSLVRTMYILVHPKFKTELHKISEPAKLKEFWHQRLSGKWKEASEAADSLDYNEIFSTILIFFP